jgi:hypothetical protein
MPPEKKKNLIEGSVYVKPSKWPPHNCGLTCMILSDSNTVGAL